MNKLEPKFPREHLKARHDSLLAELELMLRSRGVDVVRVGAEAGGHRHAPDLFIRQNDTMGIYIDLKIPTSSRIGLALDEWLYFRVLGDVFLLAVRPDETAAVVATDRDIPLFLGAARDDYLPALAYAELMSLGVPVRFFQRGDRRQTSNKPFVVFRPRLVVARWEFAVEVLVKQLGGMTKC